MWLYNGTVVEIDEPFTHDETIYPNLLNEEDRNKVGLVWIDEPPAPNDYDDIVYEKMFVKSEPYVLYIRRSDEEIEALRLAKAKTERVDIANRAKVTTSSGRVFDADEQSLIRMSVAIAALDPTESVMFVLANNEPTMVTREELREALRLGGAQFSAIWSAPYLQN